MKTNMRMSSLVALGAVLLVGWVGLSMAETPPERINLQGVLRDNAGVPVDGAQAMTFRLYDAEVGCPGVGTLLLTDNHASVGVSGGLFNVALGDGTVTPGTASSLAVAFRDNAEVWVEFEVGGDGGMCPRARVESSAYALNADHLDGVDSSGFIDTSSSAQTKAGPLVADASAMASSLGIEGHGKASGGYFKDSDESGYAFVGAGHYGIRGFGLSGGGYFSDLAGVGYAYLGFSSYGIRGFGNVAGGYFKDDDHSGYAYVGYGDIGIEGQGNVAGGYFKDSDQSGYANVGYGDRGIEGYGNEMGGYFKDSDQSGYAWVGYGHYGIRGFGLTTGGYFEALNSSGYAYVGYGSSGIQGFGNTTGGYFKDTDSSGYAYVGYGNSGIEAYGDYRGGYFEDFNSLGYASVGTGTYKILGNGAMSFVQNHPNDEDRVIVYAAPEGDEVATYTRGTARLTDGVARVPLGETFQWVTNPDIGLTAYVTARGDEPLPVTVSSLNTTELVVRGPEGASASFDYIVYGLRIGFEEVSVVQEKQEEAYIPSMADHRELFERLPELRGFNALERFKAMRMANGGADDPLDLSASLALKNAIEEYDLAIHGPVDRDRIKIERPRAEDVAEVSPGDAAVDEPGHAARGRSRMSRVEAVARPGTLPMDDEGNVYAKSFRPSAADLASLVAVAEPVEAGDVLVIDPDQPGVMSLARIAADTGVFGIVAAEPGVVLGAEPFAEQAAQPVDEVDAVVPVLRAPVALSGVALCKVDAGYGSVRPGDLLTTSPTPGHAMIAYYPRPGTILGKALEPLDTGTGLIKVLVMLR